MPPAARPCGRTVDAGKCSSEASDETKTSRSSAAAAPAPTTSSPSLSVITSQASRFAGTSAAATRLTTPDAVPRASVGAAGSSDASDTSDSPGASATTSPTGTPPDRLGALSVGGSAGRSSTEHAARSRPRDVTAPTSPRAVAGRSARRTSCRCRPPGAGRAGVVGGAGQQAGRRTAAPSTGCPRSPAGWRRAPRTGVGAARAAGVEQDRAARGAVRPRDLGHLVRDDPAQQRLVAEDRLAARRSPRASSALLLLQLDPGELRQPAQPQLEDVLGLRLGQVEDLPQPGLGRSRSRRRCG